jgi:hypothetical protein
MREHKHDNTDRRQQHRGTDSAGRSSLGASRHERIPDFIVGPGDLLIPPTDISPQSLSDILNTIGWRTRVDKSGDVVQVATSALPLSIIRDDVSLRFLSEWFLRAANSAAEKLDLINHLTFKGSGLTFSWLPPVIDTSILPEDSKSVPDLVSASFCLNYQSGVTTNQITTAANHFIDHNERAMEWAKERGLVDGTQQSLSEE